MVPPAGGIAPLGGGTVPLSNGKAQEAGAEGPVRPGIANGPEVGRSVHGWLFATALAKAPARVDPLNTGFSGGYTHLMASRETLDLLCRDFGLLAVYLFGSRKDDGLRRLAGEPVEREGSDLDVGV